MTIKTFVPGINTSFSSQLNGNFATSLRAAGLNTVRQLIDRDIDFAAGTTDCFADAYVDADGRENSVNTYATTALFSTNKYMLPTFPTGTEPYVVITATSVSGSWAINNCALSRLSTDKWVLYCTTGTDEVKRAQIYKTLFYGTNGTDPRASVSYTTGLSSIATSVSRDVGKSAYYARMSGTIVDNSPDEGQSRQYTGTFAATTGNTSVSCWSFLTRSNHGLDQSVQMPSATTLNSLPSSGTSDETGTDTSAEEKNNPTTILLTQGNTPGGSWVTYSYENRVIVLSAQSISWASTGTSPTPPTFTSTNFASTLSISAFSAASSIVSYLEQIVVHSIPSGRLPATISSSCLVPFIQDWETGADVQYKITNGSSDTGWLSCGITTPISNFTAFSTEPTTLTIKLIPKSSSPTAGFPSIRGFTLFAE